MLADRLKINYAKINAKIFQFIHFWPFKKIICDFRVEKIEFSPRDFFWNIFLYKYIIYKYKNFFIWILKNNLTFFWFEVIFLFGIDHLLFWISLSFAGSLAWGADVFVVTGSVHSPSVDLVKAATRNLYFLSKIECE